MTSNLKSIKTGKYAKRVALLTPANCGNLHDKIEKEIVEAIDLGNYTKAIININLEVHIKFGVNFWMFAKDFGEISPIVAALVEIHEDGLGLI